VARCRAICRQRGVATPRNARPARNGLLLVGLGGRPALSASSTALPKTYQDGHWDGAGTYHATMPPFPSCPPHSSRRTFDVCLSMLLYICQSPFDMSQSTPDEWPGGGGAPPATSRGCKPMVSAVRSGGRALHEWSAGIEALARAETVHPWTRLEPRPVIRSSKQAVGVGV